MTYEQFCDRLHAFAQKGGYTADMLRETPYPYADVQLRMKRGLCTIAEAEKSFADAVRRHVMRGRQMAEAS